MASNALLVVVLAAGVALLGRVWKNPLCLHLLWVFVLLKLVTPPLLTVPVALPARQAPPASEERASSRPAGHRRTSESPARCRGLAGRPKRSKRRTLSRRIAFSQRARFPPQSADAAPTAVQDEGITWLAVLGVGMARRNRPVRIRPRLPHTSLQETASLQRGPFFRRDQHGRAGSPSGSVCDGFPNICMLPVCVSPLVWSLGGRAARVAAGGPFRAAGRGGPARRFSPMNWPTCGARIIGFGCWKWLSPRSSGGIPWCGGRPATARA